jgi:hypothetical protein
MLKITNVPVSDTNTHLWILADPVQQIPSARGRKTIGYFHLMQSKMIWWKKSVFALKFWFLYYNRTEQFMKSGDIGLQHEGSVHDQKRPLFVPSRLILVL